MVRRREAGLVQNTEYRIQNVGPSLTGRVNDGADPARGKGSTAEAVGLHTARTYDHESGESQEWIRFEPSISGAHCVCAHRLYRSTQSVTEHWRGEDIEANENRSTSTHDAREPHCMNAHYTLIPAQHTAHSTQMTSPPPV